MVLEAADMRPTGPQKGKHRSVTSPVCPKCMRHSLRELDNHNYACRNCGIRYSKEQVIWERRTTKGSGVIAPSAYRYGFANWGRRR